MSRPLNEPGPGGPYREPELPAALRPLEAALASLVPRGDGLDAAAILFRAGEQAALASRRRGVGRFLAPAAIAAGAALAGSLMTLWLGRPEPRVVERIRVVGVAAPAPPVAAAEAATPVKPQTADRDAPLPPGWLAPEWFADRPRARALDELARTLRDPKSVPRLPESVPLSAIEPEQPRPYRQRLEAMLDATLPNARVSAPPPVTPPEDRS